MPLPPCWEIMRCGREPGGSRAAESGVCPAYPDFGHSCWGVAGTLCCRAVGGTFARKGDCLQCRVYRLYERLSGIHRDQLAREHPGECARFAELMTLRNYGEPDGSSPGSP